MAQSGFETYVALLRGVNVGGRGIVAMKDVRAAFERAGFSDVETYINSGNAIFRRKRAGPRRIEADAERALAAHCGLSCRVVVKSYAEYRDIAENIPPDWTDEKRWRYYVLFLAHAIDSGAILEQVDVNPEVEHVIYRPGVLFWAALRSGLTRSRVAKLSRALCQEMTSRNLNTTRKLYELMRARQ